MNVYLYRHGATDYTPEHRYLGRTDLPLSEQGRAELKRSPLRPSVVYTSDRIRTEQTADILFPDAVRIAVAGLEEMDFGIFEGKNFQDMEHFAPYREWVESGCLAPCPEGESKAVFCDRVCRAFEPLVTRALKRGEQELVIVAHGGTLMAILERYALPERDYFSRSVKTGSGYVLETDSDLWDNTRKLRERGTL